MSENEFNEIDSKIDEGLALANRRMLEAKALRDECVVVYDPNIHTTVRIKAKDLMDNR